MNTSQIISVVAACITAVAATATVCGLLYTWLSGKWKAADQINRARSKTRLGLYKTENDGSPYVNPVGYYKNINAFVDSHGKTFLADSIPFQTANIKYDIDYKIITNHKLYGIKKFDTRLYSEPGKMTIANMKNFNSLIMFIDRQINNYLDKRSHRHESLWNMEKWDRFIEVLRRKLILMRKEVENVPVNEITINVPVKGTKEKAKLTFFYSFVCRDYSKIMDIDFTTDSQEAREVRPDEVIELMKDFQGYYEREHASQFEDRVNKKLSADLFLNIHWKESGKCLNAIDFTNFTDSDYEDNDDSVVTSISAHALDSKDEIQKELAHSAGLLRHLKISSDAIQFDKDDKAYYVFNESMDRNILMMNGEETVFTVQKDDIKNALKKAIKDTFNRKQRAKTSWRRYHELKNQGELKEEGFLINPTKIDLSKIGNSNNLEDHKLTSLDKDIISDLIVKMFIKDPYPRVSKIEELPVYKCSAEELKGIKSIGNAYKPNYGEYLLNKDANTNNFVYSLQKDSAEFKDYASQMYCVEQIDDVYNLDLKEL